MRDNIRKLRAVAIRESRIPWNMDNRYPPVAVVRAFRELEDAIRADERAKCLARVATLLGPHEA